MRRLDNRVQPYGWGSATVIPDLLGREPDGTPQAEMWIGAHPSAPSLATGPDGTAVPLDELLAAEGTRLPFLMKVLAADAPLSLQVHPDLERAGRRFAEEEAAGVPRDAPHRLYKDDQHKPELMYAMVPFDALCGFRPPADALALLASLDLPGLDAPAAGALAGLREDLADPDPSTALRRATGRLLTLPADVAGALVTAVAAACEGVDDPSAQCVRDLARHYPGDPGVLVSLLLNRLRLAPGEALFMPAGNVHAYLSGWGVEVMASSDNVLRGGLTPKHVDVAELLDVVDFRVLPPPVLVPQRVSDDEVLFAPDVEEFSLHVLTARPGVATTWEQPVPRALLCLEGEVEVSARGERLVLRRGGSAFAAAGEHPLTVMGDGVLAAAAPRRA
ncbi:mannose-6-phosphate isomerase, class I [Kineococcus sp. NUM-3379]